MITRQKIMHHKRYRIALAGFVLVLISTLLSCSREEVVFIDSFLGVWKTSAPKYQDRSLKITASTIAFGIGDENANEFFVDRVIKKTEAE